MKALWLEEQSLSFREIPVPEASGEALIRVRLAGICGTDLEMVRGYYPFTGVPGHEFVGEVVEASISNWIGKRVVGEINVPCGVCVQCSNNRPTHCDHRSVLGIRDRDGAHAEYLRLPVGNLHTVPDGVIDEAAVFTEPLAAALEIQEQTPIGHGDRVLLIGAGRLGQLIARVLALTGCNLRVVARHVPQKALLAAAGIKTLDEGEIEPRSWDVVVEATGSPSGFNLARKALRPRGRLILKSTYRGEMSIAWSPFVVDEITIIGSRCGPFPPALELLEKRLVDPTDLIAQRYPLADALDAYAVAGKPGMMKVVLQN